MFALYFFKLYVFLDIWGAEITFADFMARFDVETYTDGCVAAKWYADIARIQVFTQVDVNECLIGLIGALVDETTDCTWSTYYISHPVFDWDIYEEDWVGIWSRKSECNDEIGPIKNNVKWGEKRNQNAETIEEAIEEVAEEIEEETE